MAATSSSKRRQRRVKRNKIEKDGPMKHISLHGAVSSYGADEGDRTLVPSLGSSYSTTELHPHITYNRYYISLTVNPHFVKTRISNLYKTGVSYMVSAVVARCIVAVCLGLILLIRRGCFFCIFDFLYIFCFVFCHRLFFGSSFFFEILLIFCIFRLLFTRQLVYA